MAYPGFMTAAILGVTIVTLFYFMFKERAQQQQQQQSNYVDYHPSSNGYHGNNRRQDHGGQHRWSRRSSNGSLRSVDSECSICLNTASGQMTTLESCGHIFHQTCIRKWKSIGAAGSRYCPNCRHTIDSRT